MSFLGPHSFARFLARSLTLLEAELPNVIERVARAVGERRVGCLISREGFAIIGDGRRLRLSVDTPPRLQVQIATERRVIRALLEGECSLEQAVWDERILLRGDLSDVLAFNEGLHLYLCGAVRCPSFSELLAEYMDPRVPDPAPPVLTGAHVQAGFSSVQSVSATLRTS